MHAVDGSSRFCQLFFVRRFESGIINTTHCCRVWLDMIPAEREQNEDRQTDRDCFME